MTKYYTDAYDTLYKIEDGIGTYYERATKEWRYSIACEEIKDPLIWGCRETTWEEWVIDHI